RREALTRRRYLSAHGRHRRRVEVQDRQGAVPAHSGKIRRTGGIVRVYVCPPARLSGCRRLVHLPSDGLGPSACRRPIAAITRASSLWRPVPVLANTLRRCVLIVLGETLSLCATSGTVAPDAAHSATRASACVRP